MDITFEDPSGLVILRESYGRQEDMYGLLLLLDSADMSIEREFLEDETPNKLCR